MTDKAPEKIYLHSTANGKVGASWLTFPLTNEDIEYIRKDAFIEKACVWMEKNGCGYWLDDSALPNRVLIDEFRKYMKGE